MNSIRRHVYTVSLLYYSGFPINCEFKASFCDICNLKMWVLVGVGSRVEIWSKDKWETVNSDADMDEITGAMEGLGLTI